MNIVRNGTLHIKNYRSLLSLLGLSGLGRWRRLSGWGSSASGGLFWCLRANKSLHDLHQDKESDHESR